ncbi:MAG: Ldh family oxidoreductase [Hasllibacter sp.]
MQVGIGKIEDVARRALVAHGAGGWQAGEVARAVARAEQVGNVICGLYYLESYCLQLRSGRVDGTVEPEVTAPRPGTVVADARFGFAQPAFARALPRAVEAAKAQGTATLAMGHSHTCTSLGYFTEWAAAEGLIAIGFTNASAIVAGPGGRTRALGTNPIAFTVPGDGAPALHADFSTAAVALGKITMAKAAGESIPEGWAVDAEGRPTTDPEAALGGSLVPAAGPKGWALGLLVEVLAAGMTGSTGSLGVKGLKLAEGPPHDLGQFYVLIDPGPRAGDVANRLAAVAAAVAGDEGVRIPGSSRPSPEAVEVPDALWSLALSLADG